MNNNNTIIIMKIEDIIYYISNRIYKKHLIMVIGYILYRDGNLLKNQLLLGIFIYYIY